MVLFAGANLPTPLFPIYEERYGFGSGMVTVLFAVYVVALLPVLIGMGPRPIASDVDPCSPPAWPSPPSARPPSPPHQSVAWLFAGEVIYGVGAGVVMSCVAVAIRELHPTPTWPAGGAAPPRWPPPPG